MQKIVVQLKNDDGDLSDTLTAEFGRDRDETVVCEGCDQEKAFRFLSSHEGMTFGSCLNCMAEDHDYVVSIHIS